MFTIFHCCYRCWFNYDIVYNIISANKSSCYIDIVYNISFYKKRVGLCPLVAEPPLFRIAVVTALAMSAMPTGEAVEARLLRIPNGHGIDGEAVVLLSHVRLPSHGVGTALCCPSDKVYNTRMGIYVKRFFNFFICLQYSSKVDRTARHRNIVYNIYLDKKKRRE